MLLQSCAQASPPSLAPHAAMHCASAAHSVSAAHELTTSQQLTWMHVSQEALPNGTESATSHAGAVEPSTPASLDPLAPASPKPCDCELHAASMIATDAATKSERGRMASIAGISAMLALVFARLPPSGATRIDNRSSEL
jgi:hypothetical protein